MFVLNIVFLLVCAATVQGSRRVECEFEDDACVTYGASVNFLAAVRGIKGLWERSDPIIMPRIAGETRTCKYEFLDVVFEGMEKCQVTHASIDSSASTYKYYIYCDKLVVTGKYQLQGHLQGVYVEGQGNCRNTLYRYHMYFEGDYETVTGKDGNLYMILKNNDVSFKCDDRVVYEYQNLFYGDNQKSRAFHVWANKNWRILDSFIGQRAMMKFGDKFIKNTNDHLAIVPTREIFYWYK